MQGLQPDQIPNAVPPNIFFQIPSKDNDKFGHTDTVPMPIELQAEQIKKSNRLGKMVHKYFDEAALTRLARDMDTDPKSQQELLRAYAVKIVEEVLPYVKCPDSTGALLNLDYPDNMEELEGQIKKLTQEINRLCFEDSPGLSHDENIDLRRETYAVYEDLVRRLRRDIVRLVGEGLEEKGIEKKVGVFGRFYGKGGFGTVHSCRIKDKDIAIKIHYQKTALLNQNYPQLIEASNASDNLVSFYGELDIGNPWGIGGKESKEEFSRIDFYEELKGAKSLSEYLDESGHTSFESYEFRDDFIRFLETIFIPALKGVKALHDKGLVHCDIKTDNIFVIPKGDTPDVKVGDYDTVCHSGFRDIDDIAHGTPRYMSPEQWNSKPITGKSDIFSLGLMLYELLGGKLPEDPMDIARLIAYKKVDYSDLKVSPDVKEFVGACLDPDPNERLSVDGLISLTEILIRQGKKEIAMKKESDNRREEKLAA